VLHFGWNTSCHMPMLVGCQWLHKSKDRLFATRIDNVRSLSLTNWAKSSQGRQRPRQLIKQINRTDNNIARKLQPVNLTRFQNATARHLTMDRLVIITYNLQAKQPQLHLHFNDGRPSITRQTASTSRCRLARTLWVLPVGGPRV